MRVIVLISEESFQSGNILDEKIEPPVVEFRDKDGWTRRAKLSELDKFSQFSNSNKSFLLALKETVDNLSALDRKRE